MSNVFKTALLLAVLTIMLVLLGGAIGGRQGMMVAFFFALAMNFFSSGRRASGIANETEMGATWLMTTSDV